MNKFVRKHEVYLRDKDTLAELMRHLDRKYVTIECPNCSRHIRYPMVEIVRGNIAMETIEHQMCYCCAERYILEQVRTWMYKELDIEPEKVRVNGVWHNDYKLSGVDVTLRGVSDFKIRSARLPSYIVRFANEQLAATRHQR